MRRAHARPRHGGQRQSLALAAHPGQLGKGILIGLAGYAVDLVSLYCVFRAFGQSVSFGMLVACLSIGVLFWIVAITPQGIGVVEGTMALVFTSLGIPAERATLIALAFRGLTFWLPLLIGFLLLRRVRLFVAPEAGHPAGWQPQTERLARLTDIWDVRLAAILTGLMGLINVFSAVTPSLIHRCPVAPQIPSK